MATEVLSFPDLLQITYGYYEPCSLDISQEGFEIKSLKNGKNQTITQSEVKSVAWCQVAKRYCLKIIGENGAFYQIVSFNESDYDKLHQFLNTNLHLTLKKQEISIDGKNQGDLSLEASTVKFMIDSNVSFEIPFHDICRVSSSKNEIGMEFHTNNEAPMSLCEIRLHVPNESVKRLNNQLSAKADVIKATSEALLTIPETSCLTPRGRYTLKVYPTFVELHGKTFDYKIPYNTILRIFRLRNNDQKNHVVVLSIDPPIRHGQTRHPFLVMQFETVFSSINPNNTPLDEILPDHERLCEMLQKLSKCKVITGGNFKSNDQNDSLICAYKAGNGLLYPLEGGFLFIHKPTLYIKFNEISCVDFTRGVVSSRTFDMSISVRTGNALLFTNIERDCYNALKEYCITNQIKIRNVVSRISNISTVVGSSANVENPLAEGAPLVETDTEDDDYKPVVVESSSSEAEDVEEVSDAEAR